MAALGILYTVLLFALCFAAVSMYKLAKIGLDSLKRERERAEPQVEKPKKSEPKKRAKKPEPVYYVVEKKDYGKSGAKRAAAKRENRA